MDAFEWAQLGEKYGVGEVLLTSIDNEGMQRGFENDLTERLSKTYNTIYSLWDLGKMEHAKEIFERTKCNAISFASVLHYKKLKLKKLKII